MSKSYSFLDENGTFRLEDPEKTTGLYFPIAGDSGLKSDVTPLLGGDSKLDQNTFLLQPESVEELHDRRGTRNFWILPQGGEPWSVTGVSAQAEARRGTELEEKTVLTAGLMWHRLERFSPAQRLSAVIENFVPLDDEPLEIMRVTVTNRGDCPVTLTAVSAVPLYGRSAANLRDHRHVTSLLHRAAVTPWGVEITPTLTFDERGHRLGVKTFYALGADGQGRAPEAVCPGVADFIGEGGSFTRPGAVYGYDPASPIWQRAGGALDGEEVIAALRFPEVTLLSPGEEVSWTLLLGITDRDRKEAVLGGLPARYFAPGAVDAALEEVRRHWVEKTNIHYHTGDPDFDNFLYWVNFQPTLRRIYGCSFLPYHDYGKGGRGWRDLWQDCLALLLMDPGQVRRMLVNNYKGVRFDGTNATIIGEGEGEFLADRNGIPRVWMDHGYWPWSTTRLYLDQSGDLDLLAEEIPYFKDQLISRCEEQDDAWAPEQGTWLRDAAGQVVTGTVLEHVLLQNLSAFYDVGDHNHLRLRGADWNDGLDMAAAHGESVAFTAAYAGNFTDLAELLRVYAQRRGDRMAFHRELTLLLPEDPACEDVPAKQGILRAFHRSCAHTLSGERVELSLSALADRLEALGNWMAEHIRATEWVTTSEGSFFNGYYDDHGRKLEGEIDGGVRMTLTGQVFPVMAGVADDAQIDSVAAAADRLLFAPELGGYRLNTDFHEVKTDMGRAFGFAYGHKENGAVFAHMATMYGNALYRRGRVREGYKALGAMIRHSMDFPRSRCYPGLPEYFDGRGRGLYPYLTGSASWLMLTVITEMLGVRGELGDLVLRPRLLDEQLDANGCIGVDLEFAGVPLKIRFHAAQRRALYTGVARVTLDGKPLEGDRIPRALLAASGGEIAAELTGE